MLAASEHRDHVTHGGATALRAYADEIRDAELARALARLRHLSPREASVVRTMAERIVDTLLHRPATVLRSDAEGAAMSDAVRRMFQLGQRVPAVGRERDQVAHESPSPG